MSLILAISGPAAVGKTTICERLIAEFAPRLNRLVTATTRSPRPQEAQGVDYFFLSESEFEQKLSNGSFLEHEVIHGNKYGILKETLLNAQFQGVDILLNIDVNGTSSLRRFCHNKEELKGCLKTVFIKPLTLDDLRVRLHQRASESDEQIRIRLANAEAEILREGEFDFVLESMDRDSDYQKIKDIYLSVR
ncbi:MAG: guanylate kinase [Opitutae bacterium]